MSNSDTVLFVQGIPIDLDRKGLANIFARAGPVESAKIIPPKNSSFTTTFGFVNFTNKTSAATALEMFNNYKIGNKYLNVKFSSMQKSEEKKSQKEEIISPESKLNISVTSRPHSRLSNEDWDRQSRRSSAGRGSLIHQNDRPRRGNYDLSRPFAKKIFSRMSLTSSQIDQTNDSLMFSDVDVPKNEKVQEKTNGFTEYKNEIEKTEKLKIGEIYPVYLTHVNTPSNFFVHLINAQDKTANLMNNMDNYYRNSFHEDNADLKFRETKPASIRCKLSNIRPPKGSKVWCAKAQETMDTLFKLEEPLFIKVIGVEEFEPTSGRFESIYSVDLIYGGEESILSYFIQNGLAIQNEDDDDDDDAQSILDLYTRQNYQQKKNTEPIQSTLNDHELDESLDETMDEILVNLKSVSVLNIYEKTKNETVEYPTSLFEPNNRSKLFSSSFRLFKKKDIHPTVQIYKTGQTLEVNISFIEDYKEFYVVPHSRINDLEHLESCLQRYASALLTDVAIQEELRVFQERTSRFDAVVVKINDKWKRGVFLERTSTNTLLEMFGESDRNKIKHDEKKNFFTFFLPDWGREITLSRNMNQKDLFILPFDEKLTQIGWFALKCKITDHQIKLRDTCVNMGHSKNLSDLRRRLFDEKFKSFFEDKLLRIRIAQIVNVKNETTATVDLFFLPHEANNFLKPMQFENLNAGNIGRTNLNCVQFVLDQIKDIEEEELRKLNTTMQLEETEENNEPKIIVSQIEENNIQKKDVQKPIPVQKKQLVEEIQEPVIEKVTSDYEKLEVNKTYNVNLQYYDENMQDVPFYVCLTDKFSKLEQLDVELQKQSNDKLKFKYVENLSELKLNDKLEALYESDSKWYRVEIRQLDIKRANLEIYFLDYGNSEKLDQMKPKSLRFRQKYDSQEEKDLFKLEYQAIKCCYKSQEEDSLSLFIDKLAKMEDIEAGFNLHVKNIIRNDDQDIYIVLFSNEVSSAEDQEYVDIQKPIPVQKKQLVEEIQEPVIEKVTSDYEKLEVNKTYNVNLQYYDENMQDVPFYVCLTDKFSKLEQLDVELQKQSNDILKFKYVENLSELKLNDKLEALYESDSKWYRVEIRQLDIKRANLEIYFLDYGNSEKLDQMKPKSLRFRQKYDSQEEKDLFKLEYQAIKCCYKSQEEDSLSLFIDKLAKMEDIEAGFNLHVKNIIRNDDQDIYIVLFSDEVSSAEDQEYVDIQKKVQELTIEDIQKPIPVQTKQLVEEIQEPVIEKVTSDYEKLEVNKTYNVNLQYYDENMQDVPFYVCLTDKFSKLEQLDVELQKQSNDILKFKYVENLSELKLNDKLEALYESDSKWYRVEIRQLDIKRANLEIYFLDYGNSEKLDQMKPKSLRFRQKYDSQEEKDLFKLEYQAIKCCYKSQEEDSLSLFIDKLAKMEDIEAGFNLHVKNIIRNDDQDIYIVLFSDEVSSAEDQEVSQILESNQEMKEEILIEEEIQIPNDSIQLEKDSILTELTVSHVETISEFYVQTAQTLKIFLDFQGKIQRLLEIMVHKASQNPQITSKQLFKIGDFVFAKFMADLNWYRAVIINVQPKTEHSEYEDGPNDGFLYEVYFVDYGNKQEDLPSNLIYSFQSVKSLNLNLNFMSMEDLNYIINLPFQAICCQLIDKKENTRNNEVLKSLLQEYFNFDITVLNTTKAKILNDIEINKYLVKLGTGGTSLDDQFESVEIQQTKKEQVKILRPKFIENILKIDEIYECKLNVLESDIYLNLIEQVELFTKLETELTQASIDLKWSTEPDVNDLVLGKFYLDETNFTWCRALVIKKENFKYDIYFFDYGNVSNDVSIDDLAHLESDYGLDKYPVFAYKTNLFDIQLDLDKHGVILADFLMETFKIKIINIQSPTQDQEINVTKYFIEIWDNEMKQCLNKLLDKNYTIKQKEMAQQHAIDKTNLSELYLNNKTAELKVKVKYIFMDNLIKPFYFCLRNDFEMRKNLDTELNSYYSNNNDSISEFKVNSYLAVYSESSWYRAQIKKLDSNLMTLFYIDYGYDEIVDLNENNLERLRKLAQQFFKYPRFAFGAGLINVLDDKTDSYSLINFDEQDNEFLSDVLKEYFENNSSYFESNLIVLSKLNSSSLNEYFMPNEEYYGIEMYNDKNMCLNEMIAGIKEKKLMKKELRPNGLKLDLTKLPKQSPTNGNYCVFARSLDLFYVYNENKVVDIQKLTQDTCEKILKDQEEFDMSQVDKPDVNNLVYAKYDDDITWYRCLVTNCDENKTKYELFYIDFGNTEIINSSEILTGWTEDQMMPFLNYEAQAYKCKLIGLRPKNTKKEFDNNENNLFKQFITDKVFNVNFIKSDNDTNEVSIEQIASGHGEGMTSSAHVFAIKKDLAEFSNLSEILKSKRTQAENQFYTNLFKIF